jgi:ribonucleases P/MRP protein subunit RPP40
MRNYSYEERLKLFNLTTLETRKIRGDLIQVFRILKGYEDVNARTFF